MYFAIPDLFFFFFSPSSIRHIASITIIEVLAAIGLVVWAAGYRFIRGKFVFAVTSPRVRSNCTEIQQNTKLGGICE